MLLRPKFWPGHLAMVVSVAIAVGLGLWQLDAWSQHRADAARDLAHEPAVPLSTVMDGDSPFPGRSLGRPVSFSGTWLTEDTVYVSAREHDGHEGYWVVTPVLVSGTQSAMPVVRGWSPSHDVSAPSGPVQLSGWLEPTEGSGGVDQDPQDNIIPAMRIASLVELIDTDLYSGYVVARDSTTHEDALAPVEPAASPGVSAFTGLRNLLYAIEWWVFGAFALFIWVRWCQDSLRDARAPDEVGAA
jgi:cytochrome oxidase assembly protein ShyY1